MCVPRLGWWVLELMERCAQVWRVQVRSVGLVRWLELMSYAGGGASSTM